MRCFRGAVGAMVGLLLLCASSDAWTQQVRRENLFGAGSSRTLFNRAAREQGQKDWLQPPYARPGTQVRITFDARNADVTLMTNRAYGLPRLLATAQHLAQQLQMPRADFITQEGTKTVTVDVEFNKYLRIARHDTDFTLDLRALADALRASDLPSPIVFGVQTDEAERVTLQANGTAQRLDGYWFAGIDTIKPASHLQFHSSIPPSAYVLAGIMGVLMLLPAGLPWMALRLRIRRLQSPPPPEQTPDPEEVQRKYDSRKPQWLGLLPMLFVPAFLIFFSRSKLALASVFLALPVPPQTLFGGLFLLWLTSFGACALVAQWRKRQGLDTATTPQDEAIQNVLRLYRTPARLFMAVIGLGLPLPFLILAWPAYTPEALMTRRGILLGVLILQGVLLIVVAVLFRRAGQSLRRPLTEGVWVEMVRDLAARADVRVRQVVQIDAPGPNAFAFLNGTVGLTRGLLEKLEPDEVRAVIAHELGHIKSGHVRRTLLVVLLSQALIWGIWYWMRYVLLRHALNGATIGGPFFFIAVSNVLLILIVNPGKRRREAEADRLAVQWTGDPQALIRALTKIHTLSAMPHRLKRSDEVLSTHPSLDRRIKAIEDYR